jgi:hypothetical protein
MDMTGLHEALFKTAGPEDLEKIIKEHPYFGIAHFFKLGTLPDNHPEYASQAAKTALFFSNPHMLNLRLERFKGGQAGSIPQPLPLSQPATKEDELIFEPLHTSDYFASQGIKMSEEVKADDKLGQQLKSFTAWLKSMKKLPDAQALAHLPPDSQVEKMAVSSNDDQDVITETMASVLVEQGKISRAIEIYEKLSLQNPAKKAYFAAKINNLKAG